MELLTQRLDLECVEMIQQFIGMDRTRGWNRYFIQNPLHPDHELWALLHDFETSEMYP